jgi:hypothetical protein
VVEFDWAAEQWRELGRLWAVGSSGALFYCSLDPNGCELRRLDPRTGSTVTLRRLPRTVTSLTVSTDERRCVYSYRQVESETILLVENFR